MQQSVESDSLKNIISEYQTDRIRSNEIGTDQEGLRQSIRRRLLRIGELHSVVRTIAQQTTESRQILRGRDHENLPNPRTHQYRNRIVDHRLVVNGQQLLAHPFSHRIQPGTRSSCKNNSFHNSILPNGKQHPFSIQCRKYSVFSVFPNICPHNRPLFRPSNFLAVPTIFRLCLPHLIHRTILQNFRHYTPDGPRLRI